MTSAIESEQFPFLKAVIWFRYILACLVVLTCLPSYITGMGIAFSQNSDGSTAMKAYDSVLLGTFFLVFIAAPSYVIARGLTDRKCWSAWVAISHDILVVLGVLTIILYCSWAFDDNISGNLRASGSFTIFTSPFVIEGTFLIFVISNWRRTRSVAST